MTMNERIPHEAGAAAAAGPAAFATGRDETLLDVWTVEAPDGVSQVPNRTVLLLR